MNEDARITVDVIIVNWNGDGLLRRCLGCLAASELGNVDIANVIVVDNASVDRSMEGLDQFALPIRAIRNDRNVGFSTAVNIGAKLATSKYILLLNPDLNVAPLTIQSSVSWLDRHAVSSKIAACGIRLSDAQGCVAATTARIPKARHILQQIVGLHVLVPHGAYGIHVPPPQETKEVEHVIGAYYLVKREVFDTLGGLDERFFMYFEDLDLSARIRALGHSIWYLADIEGSHDGGGVSSSIPARRLALAVESRIKYGFKHFSAATAFLLVIATIFVEFPIRFISQLRMPGRWQAVRDILMGWCILVQRLGAVGWKKWLSGKEDDK